MLGSYGIMNRFVDILECFAEIRRRQAAHFDKLDDNLLGHFEDGFIGDWFYNGL